MKVRRVLLGACVALALPVSAQAGPLDGIFNGIWDTDSADGLQPSRHLFMNTLYGGYYDLSASRNTGFDNDDAELFHQKARGAFRGAEVLPEEISDRDLTPEDEAELTLALLRLRRAFVKGGREVAPRAAVKSSRTRSPGSRTLPTSASARRRRRPYPRP